LSGNIFFSATPSKNGKDPVVDIAGWEVNKDSISRGSIGDKKSYILHRTGLQANKPLFGNPHPDELWSLAIGEHFGVTAGGALYATAGKIGNVDIEALASGAETYGINLVQDQTLDGGTECVLSGEEGKSHI
jgi:hypothetical protein